MFIVIADYHNPAYPNSKSEPMALTEAWPGMGRGWGEVKIAEKFATRKEAEKALKDQKCRRQWLLTWTPKVVET